MMRRGVTVRVGVAVALVVAARLTVAMATEQSAARMASAAQAFLAALGPEQKAHARFEYGSPERMRWHFIPDEMFPRKGLTFRAMTPDQQEKARALLRTGLSAHGYGIATSIIQLENVLRVIENSPRFARSPLDYHFTVFGDPAARGSWGWRVEGHHLSLHFSIANGRVTASSPTFTGANPAEVREGPAKGQRVLASLEDAGRALVEALTEPQRQTAVLAGVAPGDIVSANTLDIGPLGPPGLAASRMTPAQRDQLMKVIGAYTTLMADDVAAERMQRLTGAGTGAITFSWAGPLTRGAKHYYRVQGPTFLIEYDNTQNDGNHIHAVWRDFQGDFGRDVLREHVAADHAR
jgi:hypothetical protein